MSESLYPKRLASFKAGRGRVAVVGLGYVGLPVAVAFAEAGMQVTGFDVDRRKVATVRRGRSPVRDISSARLKTQIAGRSLRAAADPSCLARQDAIIVCVPTPLKEGGVPDLSFVESAVEAIGRHMKPGTLVVIESTSYPGTTDEVVLPRLAGRHRTVGRDFYLAFSPERIDPGNKQFGFEDIPKIVAGVTPRCRALAEALYRKVVKRVVPVSSTRTAEMAKVLENTFRIVNISLVNELALAARDLRVDIWEAIEAAATKPFGFMPFYPGPGVGGHCVGIDPLYLYWKARGQKAEIRSIDVARQINDEMPEHMVQRMLELLTTRRRASSRPARVLILGVSYKRDVPDVRESPALLMLHKLKALGLRVSYHDPWVPVLHEKGLALRSRPLTARELRSHDLVVVATDHTGVNYALVARSAWLIFDPRRALRDVEAKDGKKIIGF